MTTNFDIENLNNFKKGTVLKGRCKEDGTCTVQVVRDVGVYKGDDPEWEIEVTWDIDGVPQCFDFPLEKGWKILSVPEDTEPQKFPITEMLEEELKRVEEISVDGIDYEDGYVEGKVGLLRIFLPQVQVLENEYHKKLDAVMFDLLKSQSKPAFPEHYIVCAAIKTEDGIVHTGKRHSDCFATIYAKGYTGTVEYDQFIQGFVDNKWQFKTRDEAFDIAIKANQLQAERNGNEQTLYSEGIY